MSRYYNMQTKQRIVGEGLLHGAVAQIDKLIAAMPEETRRRYYVEGLARQLEAVRGHDPAFAARLAERYTRRYGMQPKVGRP